jgi:hypothetical protein
MSRQENKDTRRKAVHFSEQLPTLQVDELTVLAKILGADIKRRVKGGAFEMLGKDELVHGIRSVLGRGTFLDRIERFNLKASEFFDDRVV